MSVAAFGMSSHPRPDLGSEWLLQRACDETDPRRADRLRGQVVLENQGLATAIARQFANKGVEQDDLVQVAMVGLVQAARRYRPGAEHGFVAFAVPTISGELKRHFRDHGWAVRPPRALQEIHGRVRRMDADLEQVLHRSPTDSEVAEHLDVPEESVRQARIVDHQYRAASLDAPIRPTAKLSLGDSLVDEKDPYERMVALMSLRSALDRLSPRERLILRLRFVDNLAQRQIGRRIGVSQMQVSRLLRDICHELRETIEDRGGGGSADARGWRSAG